MVLLRPADETPPLISILMPILMSIWRDAEYARRETEKRLFEWQKGGEDKLFAAFLRHRIR